MSCKVRSAMDRWRGALAVILAAAILLPASAAKASGYDRVGEASWYGTRYQGRTTASGETYDMNALTAAHRHLAFGTLVQVTNLANRRSVVVRINDRGPYARRRIIDLSRRGADLLGFETRGVVRVRVKALNTRQSIQKALMTSRNFERIRLRPPPGVRH